jgi:chromate transporter
VNVDTLLNLAFNFMMISLLSVGGGGSTIPEMHRNAVDSQGWMSSAQFSELYALAQAAPGPTTTMFVSLIGWKAAGPLGALVAVSSVLGPSCLVTYFVSRTWDRFKEATWRELAQAGLIPVTIGLMFAAAWLVTSGAVHGWPTLAIAAVSALVMATTRLNPLWMISAGAVAGLLGWA